MGMTTGNTTNLGKLLTIDAETGRVTLANSQTSTLAFEMHDLGYIWLDPCTPFARDIPVSYTANSTTVTSTDSFYSEFVGQYIYIDSGWRKITEYVDEHTVKVETAPTHTGAEKTQIVSMNIITFSGFTLSSLSMSFTPRVR